MIFISLWKGSSINEGSKECIHPAELLREKQACEKISNWILGKYFREYDIETCMSANSTIGKAEHMHLAGRWGHLCITAYVKATYSDLCKHTLWPLKASDELGGSASDFCTLSLNQDALICASYHLMPWLLQQSAGMGPCFCTAAEGNVKYKDTHCSLDTN